MDCKTALACTTLKALNVYQLLAGDFPVLTKSQKSEIKNPQCPVSLPLRHGWICLLFSPLQSNELINEEYLHLQFSPSFIVQSYTRMAVAL